MPFQIVRNDITNMQVDAIVNTATRQPVVGTGTDYAIHTAAGPQLLEERKRIGYIPRGQSAISPAFGLEAKYVIHTVGPNFAAGERDRSLLESCYRRSLEVADDLGVQTIAFPLISAGIYGWPLEDAVNAAVETIRSTPTNVELARIVAFNDELFDLVIEALG